MILLRIPVRGRPYSRSIRFYYKGPNLATGVIFWSRSCRCQCSTQKNLVRISNTPYGNRKILNPIHSCRTTKCVCKASKPKQHALWSILLQKPQQVFPCSSFSFNLSIYLHLSVYLSVYLSVFLSIYLSVYPSIYPSIYLSIYPFIYQSIFLPFLFVKPLYHRTL